MCNLLDVCRSTYYKSVNSKINVEKISQEEKISRLVIQIYYSSSGIYGSRKIKKSLKKQFNVCVSRRKVRKIMEANNLISKYATKKYKPYKAIKVTGNIFDNILDRRFDGWEQGEVLTADLTYIPLKNGKFAYVCFIVDLFNREIVGYNVSAQHNTPCVMDALSTIQFDLNSVLMFHCDRGGEFRGNKFIKYITSYGIEISMSNAGTPHDNAVSENLFSLLKKEWAFEIYDELEDVQNHITKFVKWYNNIRIHSFINYCSPVEFRLAFEEQQNQLFA